MWLLLAGRLLGQHDHGQDAGNRKQHGGVGKRREGVEHHAERTHAYTKRLAKHHADTVPALNARTEFVRNPFADGAGQRHGNHRIGKLHERPEETQHYEACVLPQNQRDQRAQHATRHHPRGTAAQRNTCAVGQRGDQGHREHGGHHANDHQHGQRHHQVSGDGQRTAGGRIDGDRYGRSGVVVEQTRHGVGHGDGVQRRPRRAGQNRSHEKAPIKTGNLNSGGSLTIGGDHRIAHIEICRRQIRRRGIHAGRGSGSSRRTGGRQTHGLGLGLVGGCLGRATTVLDGQSGYGCLVFGAQGLVEIRAVVNTRAHVRFQHVAALSLLSSPAGGTGQLRLSMTRNPTTCKTARAH